MRLRMLIGRLRLRQLAGERIDVEMTLAGAVDAIGPMKPGVEPLRGIRGDALGGEHIGQLVHEGGGVFFRREIAALPAPVGPGAGETGEDLAGIGFRAVLLFLRQRLHRFLVCHGAPQEGGDVVFLDLLQDLRDPGLAEIFLRENVGRDLGELRRHVDVGQPEDDGAVRVADLADRLAEFDPAIGARVRLGETTFDAHCLSPSSVWRPVKRAQGVPLQPTRVDARSRLSVPIPGEASGDVYPYVVVSAAATLLHIVLTESFRQSQPQFRGENRARTETLMQAALKRPDCRSAIRFTRKRTGLVISGPVAAAT